VTVNDELNFFAVDDIKQLARAGEKLIFVVVLRPGFAVHGEEALHHDGVDGKKHGACLWKAEQDGLMARRVATGFEQSQAGKKFGIAMDEAIAKRRMIPVSTRESKTRVAVARDLVMLPLHDEFGAGKRVVKTGMVDVEMGANDRIDVVGAQAEFGEMLEDVFFIRGGRRSRRASVSSHAGIDQDVPIVGCFDEVARQDHFHGAALGQWKSGRRELYEIKFPERNSVHVRVASFVFDGELAMGPTDSPGGRTSHSSRSGSH